MPSKYYEKQLSMDKKDLVRIVVDLADGNKVITILLFREVAVIFKIVFSLFDEGITREVCGFEMGYISFIYGDNNDIYDDLNHQPLMIFLTISELILGLAEYEEKRLSSKEIIAVDSSYSLKFVRKDKVTDLVVNNDFTITVDTKILLKEICCSSIEFCKMYDSSLLPSIKNDLDYAFDKAGKMI